MTFWRVFSGRLHIVSIILYVRCISKCIEISLFQWYLTIHNFDLHWNTCTVRSIKKTTLKARPLPDLHLAFLHVMWDSSLVETSSDSWQALWAPGWSSFCQPFCCDVYCYPCNFIEVRTLKCTGQGSCFGGQGGEQKRAMLRNVEQLLEQQDLRELSFEGWLMIWSQWYTQTQHNITAKLFKPKAILLLNYIIHCGGLAGCQEDTSEVSYESKD